jgi:predicted nucleic-acid-binding Zn-ribbon protein
MSSSFPPGPVFPIPLDAVAPDITADELVRYMHAKHKGVCPACLERNFATGNLPPNQLQAVPTYAANGGAPAYNFLGPFPVAFLPTVYVLCQNCGFVETFAAAYVKKWIAENPR